MILGYEDCRSRVIITLNLQLGRRTCKLENGLFRKRCRGYESCIRSSREWTNRKENWNLQSCLGNGKESVGYCLT